MNLLEILGMVLVIIGMPFILLGTLGLLRFPDIFTRLHTLPKSDNIGLGLTCLGLGIQSGSLLTTLKLLMIWMLMLIAAANGSGLIARTAATRGVKPWRP